MATKIHKSIAVNDISGYKQALDTAHLSIEYEKSCHIVNSLIRDEDIRRLKCQILLLQDENDLLNDKLATEEENADVLQLRLEYAENAVDELELLVQQFENDLRIRDREYETAKAELAAMATLNQDSTKILTEKLALAREVAVLKPEIESLRAQVETNKSLLLEKLALQRELTTVQVELENAQRSTQRAIAKAGNNNHDQSEFDIQIDDLQKKLREAKLAKREAESEVEQLKHDLEAEKRNTNRSKSKKTKQDGNLAEMEDEIESLKKELNKAKEKISRLESEPTAAAAAPQQDGKVTQLREQIKELQQELLNERKEKAKLEKSFHKEQTAWEAQKSLLDDKLDQFRTKLRSTKERLKEAEAHLESITQAPQPEVAAAKPTKTKVTKKRNAPKEIPLESPEPPAKRGKRAPKTTSQPSQPGAKSDFSITPFLNRTSLSIVPLDPDTPTQAATGTGDQTQPDATVEDVDSPVAQVTAKKSTKPKIKPLSAAPSSKHNAKANKLALGRMSSLPSLPEVAEENSELSKLPQPNLTETLLPKDIPTEPTETRIQAKSSTTALNAPKLKPRKSLMTFTSYTAEQPAEKKKKRKLGIGKTLFDEEDDGDNAMSAKPIPGRGLFAARALAKGKGGLAKSSMLGSSVLGKTVTTDGGFVFSPLKKDRRMVGSSILE